MTPKPPASLVRHLREARCVLFVGSGLSAWGGLPTWSKLLRHMVDETRAEDPDSSDLGELDRLLDAGKLLEIADYCKEQLGERRYSEILADRLRGTEGNIPEPHRLIVQLPFAAVVTTNYDKLLERAYASLTGRWPKTPTHLDSDTLGPLLFDSSFFILKAHGDIDRPDSLVLTARDYRQIVHSNPAFNEIFSAILLTNAILFIGYSLNDPDFRMLLDRQLTIFKGYTPERYALMSGVGSVEQDILWRTARIKVLSYAEDQHHEVVAFLGGLQREVEKAPPPERPVARPKVIELPTVEVKQPSPLSSTILSIRLQGRVIEAAVTTRDRAVQGTGQPSDWSDLSFWLGRSTRGGAHEIGEASRKIGQALAQCLPEPALRALQDISSGDVIVLDLSSEIEPLPWEWTHVGDQYLFLRNPVARAPIGISNAARGYPLVLPSVRVLLIGDTTDDLPGARAEIEEIAQAYGERSAASCTTLVGSQATFDTVVRQLLTGNYDVVHFAGHAWYDAQEAYLMLHSEVVLRASAFRSLLSPRPPGILMLNSHYTAFIPPGARRDPIPIPGIEDIPIGSSVRGRGGFTEVAVTTGVGAFIGCLGIPSDAMASEIGVNVHRELLHGTPVAVALHRARLLSVAKGTPDWTWLLYVMSGYAELVLPREEVRRM